MFILKVFTGSTPGKVSRIEIENGVDMQTACWRDGNFWCLNDLFFVKSCNNHERRCSKASKCEWKEQYKVLGWAYLLHRRGECIAIFCKPWKRRQTSRQNARQSQKLSRCAKTTLYCENYPTSSFTVGIIRITLLQMQNHSRNRNKNTALLPDNAHFVQNCSSFGFVFYNFRVYFLQFFKINILKVAPKNGDQASTEMKTLFLYSL